MQVSKIIVREPVQLGFFCRIVNQHEIDIVGDSGIETIRVFASEFLKLYARKSHGTPKQLGNFRSTVSTKRHSYTNPLGFCWAIGDITIELA